MSTNAIEKLGTVMFVAEAILILGFGVLLVPAWFVTFIRLCLMITRSLRWN